MSAEQEHPGFIPIHFLDDCQADGRLLAEGCDDLVNTILRAFHADHLDRKDLAAALMRHSDRLLALENGEYRNGEETPS